MAEQNLSQRFLLTKMFLLTRTETTHSHKNQLGACWLTLSSHERTKQITSGLNVNHKDPPMGSHTALRSRYFRDVISLKAKLKDNRRNSVQQHLPLESACTDSSYLMKRQDDDDAGRYTNCSLYHNQLPAERVFY